MTQVTRYQQEFTSTEWKRMDSSMLRKWSLWNKNCNQDSIQKPRINRCGVFFIGRTRQNVRLNPLATYEFIFYFTASLTLCSRHYEPMKRSITLLMMPVIEHACLQRESLNRVLQAETGITITIQCLHRPDSIQKKRAAALQSAHLQKSFSG